ncbi:hypothetical protein L484_015692 [Morus notabilis]|uniref:GCK domain-containing protein n=2 Tax=Morus notabilis TaxID=981085 RepID=W9S8D6_9ROSA|nr:hypothetical protein L484_015692 [Morus notabilis]
MSASDAKSLEESNQPLNGPIDAEPQQEEEKPREDSNSSDKVADSDNGGQEEEEEGECGFCLFMKGGGCRESFIAWEKCIEEAEKNKEDIVEKCFEVTGALKKCMEAHADYYEPVLRAEKAAEAEVVKELEKEAAEAEAAKGLEKNDAASGDLERQGASNSTDK